MANITGNPTRGLVGGTLGFFSGFAAVALFGPSATKFQAVMHLSPLMLGLLTAASSLSGSLLRIPFGAWVDTTGGRKPFLVLLLASVVGMAGLTWFVFAKYPDGLTADHYGLLFFLGVLSGCGIATFSVGIGHVSYWFPQSQQGAALGTYAGVGNLAPGLFSLLLPLSLGTWGLASSYLAWLVCLAAGTAAYYLVGCNAPYFQLLHQGVPAEESVKLARDAGQEMFPRGNALQSLGTAARKWQTWALTAIYFASFGGFIALTAWLPTYWTSFHMLELRVAGLLTALFSLTCSLVRIPGGKLADRLEGERALRLSLVTMGAGGILMTLARTPSLAVFAVVIMAVGMGVVNAAVFKLVPQEVKEAVGGAAGWVGGLGAFGGFAIPPLMGLFVKTQGMIGYASGFSIFVVLAAGALGLALLLRRSHGEVVAAVAQGVEPS